MTFSLHTQLAADTFHVTDLKICRVLLMNNAIFPWLILVPMRDDMHEIFDLKNDYTGVMEEVRMVSEKFSAFTKADKMNIATLGNMVPQLHIHIIARFKSDKAWPNPVWNSGISAKQYEEIEYQKIVQKLRTYFS